MRKSKKFVVALAAALFVSAVPTTAFGDVILYNSSKTSTSTSKESKGTLSSTVSKVKTLVESGAMSLEEIEELGPEFALAAQKYVKSAAQNTAKELGITLQEALGEEDVEAGFRGPCVTQVNLGQTYHEAYETYELSMGDQFFLYSNVGNGAMTHEPVIVDIPANVAYTVEKDGVPYTYTSKTYIYEKGTYVMKLMGIVNKNAPLSEQEEYQATFRFRIQDAPPAEVTEAEQETAAAVENTADSSGGSAMWNDVDTEVSTNLPNLVEPEINTGKETAAAAEETKAPAAAETETEPEPETEAASELMAAKREQKLELATGNYIVSLENGKQLKTSVPEGFVGAGPVTVSVSEDEAAYVQLYRNDELVPFVNDDVISEYGHYRVEMDGESYYFTLAYGVSEMSIYPAPAGMKFAEASLDDQLLNLTSDQYVEMDKEGTYRFLLKGEKGDRFEVELVKDITAPEVAVTVEKSTAMIDYVSEDIEAVALVCDGEPVEGFRGTRITDPGDYVLTVYDGAGNSTSVNFTLKYQINAYGILAVVLVILTIAGITAFTIHIKKNSKVR